jgi:glycine/D-amino acid oxidase-like deaminating enzyme
MFTQDFAETPYWWDIWDPRRGTAGEELLPAQADVVIVGAGYAGISCALELARNGTKAVVLEEQLPGIGASTRNGGQVTGGVNVGKVPSGAEGSPLWLQRQAALLSEAADAYRLFETLLERHGIECGYHRNGRITGAWTAAHLDAWRGRLQQLNDLTDAGAYVMSAQQMREEIATGIYAGGIMIARAGYIDPGLYFRGLLGAATEAGATVCGNAGVVRIDRRGNGFMVHTARGSVHCRDVVIATNGYTAGAVPALRRKVVSVTSHQIATEELPPEIARSLIPKFRAVAETRRVINYYRLSSDKRRLLFGGRARFYPLNARQSAQVLHRQMVQRFPQLADVKVSHSWGGQVALTFDFLPHIGRHEGIHYALGCNGSGVTMMTYLGWRIARALAAQQDIAASAYGTPAPLHPLYHGKPWFMPVMGSYYQMRDVMDLHRSSQRAA